MSTDRSSAALDALPPGPFLGRRVELARLCRAVEQTRDGRGGRLWIVGPQGIGKSRLLAEIAQYGALRNVPVERASSNMDPDAYPIGPGLVIVDPVANAHVTVLDDRLRRASERGILGLATATSFGQGLPAGIPETAVIAVEGLDSNDSFRLLRAWLGPAIELAWARRIIQSTHGHPGQMRLAAERLLTTNRGGGLRGRAAPTSDA
ncbi:MAG: ATP-binding protein [Deltaproteobacteria bacterium]|nr:ATP-binding protein [Deltaproteobacteria bacterium]MBW2388431.1 ATP-binding protein [Deltaproteobacteria bacterium]